MTRKFSVAKKVIKRSDPRIKANQEKVQIAVKEAKEKKDKAEKQVEQTPTAMFFQYNTQLGPPYHVLVDTNFINFRCVFINVSFILYFFRTYAYKLNPVTFIPIYLHDSIYYIIYSIKNKLEIYKSMMDCLLAKCIPCITDCVMAELEKLGTKFRLALRLAKDPRFERLPCDHPGTYADDCLLHRCQQHRCYIVATCDRDLKRRIRKVPGVPIMFVQSRKYSIERMPEAFGAPK